MKRALILTGGALNLEFAKHYIENQSYDCLIAVDNGLKYADLLNLLPDVIVGDFDTASYELVQKYQEKEGMKIIQLAPMKDETDTESAVDYCIDMRYDEVVFLGAMGGRFDHTMANLHMLYRLLQHQIQGVLVDEQNVIRLLNRSVTIEKSKLSANYISFLPFMEQVEGVTLKGFLYPLNKSTLEPGRSIGISNVAVEEICEISFERGILIMIEAHD